MHSQSIAFFKAPACPLSPTEPGAPLPLRIATLRYTSINTMVLLTLGIEAYLLPDRGELSSATVRCDLGVSVWVDVGFGYGALFGLVQGCSRRTERTGA
eukprot:501070-Rhodomonas_salina.1